MHVTKHTLKAFVPLLLLTVASCEKASRAPIQQQHSDHSVRIGSVLPSNWELNESSSQIIISRREPVTTYTCVGLDIDLISHPDRLREHIEHNGSKQDYKIRLRVTPKVEFAEYSQLKTSNDQITVTKWTIIQDRDFYEPDALRSFDPRYRELPEYYDEHSSIYLETALHPGECVYPNEAAVECERVLISLDSLFKRYDGKSGQRALGWPTSPR